MCRPDAVAIKLDSCLNGRVVAKAATNHNSQRATAKLQATASAHAHYWAPAPRPSLFHSELGVKPYYRVVVIVRVLFSYSLLSRGQPVRLDLLVQYLVPTPRPLQALDLYSKWRRCIQLLQ